jgi:hypothetical protein
MNISPMEKASVQPVAPASEADHPKTIAAPNPVNHEDPVSRESVSISGRALLMARCFEGHMLEPSVLNYAPELSGAFPTLFLTHQDRNILSDVYAFANEQGADLAYVDELAWELAHYRRTDNGREILPQRPMMSFDRDGHEVTYIFNDKSAATASRILTGDSIQSTSIDKGFLRFTLDINYKRMSTQNLDFLEQIVAKFSGESSVEADFGRRFSNFQKGQKNYIKIVSEQVYNLSNRQPLGEKATDGEESNKVKQSRGSGTSAPHELSSIFRQIVGKYLRESGLPTLFDTLRRLGK